VPAPEVVIAGAPAPTPKDKCNSCEMPCLVYQLREQLWQAVALLNAGKPAQAKALVHRMAALAGRVP